MECKVVFCLAHNKNPEFPGGNCKIAWGRLISKYPPHTALSLLKLKNKFHNSKLDLVGKNPNKWISNLEEI